MKEIHDFTDPVPVTIISGFLGAGKTSLLNYLLNANHGLRVAVLVNDFGEINIDAELVSGVAGESSIELSNGCICCSIRNDLLDAVVQLMERPEPLEYIVIETSGVSDPMAVSLTFMAPQLHARTRVDSILTVVDAEQIGEISGKSRELALEQIAIADMVVLNKIDLVDDRERGELAGFIRNLVPRARLFEAEYGRVPLAMVLGVGGYDPERFADKTGVDVHVHADGFAQDRDHADGHHHEPHTDHTLVFNTWCYRTNKPLSRRAVRDAMIALPAAIYRAKGFVYLDDKPGQKAIVHVAGIRVRLITGEPWGEEAPETKLVFIGEEGGIDVCELQSRLDACRLEHDGHLATELDVDAEFIRAID